MLPPVYGKEIWNEVAGKTKLSNFVTASQEAFALLLYKNGYEAWSWMLSDSSSSSEGDGIEVPKKPTFKYTSRSVNQAMARNSGWTEEGLNAFDTLYGLVTKDREDNGEVFDDALLKYYEERNKKKGEAFPLKKGVHESSLRYVMTWLDLLMSLWQPIPSDQVMKKTAAWKQCPCE